MAGDVWALGEGWSGDDESQIWSGNASSVSFNGDIRSMGQGITIMFTIGDPLPTYTVALKEGTANADKVTLSATSAVEGATVTVTPDDEYEITAFKATYNTTEELSTSFNAETGAYSFTMPAFAVTIEATIALKPVPEGDIFAGFTATAGSGGFSNEGHANLVDNKYISSDWTKWCANDGHKSVPTGESESCWWIDFEASAALNPTGYILTTGNDSGSEQGRNPKNWVLKAKLNADDAWTTIATVTNDVTMKNQSFKDYKFFVDQSGSYQYFRFEVFANQGANVMQLCELRLIGAGTEAPDPEPEPQPAGPIPCTAADLGKVLCTDGSIYATVSDATAASKTAAAVIAYVDTENGKALALALANESGTMDWETAKTTAAAHTPAVSGGTWTLASKDDWDNMINAAGGYNALRDGFSGVGGTNIQKGQYWTSTESSNYSGASMVLNFGTNDGGYFIALYEDAYNVRACLAFDISAAPTPTVWTSLSVGDVIKVGDKIEVPAEGDGSWGINGNVLRNAWGPYTLIRADIYQASEIDDPVVTETEDGAFYVFKAENSDFYPLSYLGKSGGLVVTTTSDGLVVTAAENKERMYKRTKYRLPRFSATVSSISCTKEQCTMYRERE